jgi:hypothetical protein
MKTYPYPSHLDLRHGPARTSGIHLSSIIRHMALKTGILAKEYGEGPDLTELIATVAPEDVGKDGRLMKCVVGYMWEAWLKRVLAKGNPRFIADPGEATRDDITGTPDALETVADWHASLLGSAVIVHEIKATWKTSARPIEEQIMWLQQVMGYCWMLEGELGEPCRLAIFHPLYLVGDYRANRMPIYLPMLCEFEQKELEMNWQMIMDHKYDVMPEVWG